jgi:Cdc6-like AAA superfamily ATPase
LLVGRADDGVRFCTLVDSAPEGVLVISGSPGVGKTSFLNVFQHLLEAGEAACGPKLMAARTLCSIQSQDSARDVALRVLQTLIRNVRDYCNSVSKPVPGQIDKLSGWINNKPVTSWDFSISVLGNGGGLGRSVSIPALSEATFENFQDAIAIVVSDVVAHLNKDGVFIVLDNVENLDDEKRLAELLMAFRDTLFSTPRAWWVIIGQGGLYSLIQALDQRVTDRITGSGLELKPISNTELDKAVDQRVEKFHAGGKGTAPISPAVTAQLYSASFGEIRFVFKYCNNICMALITEIRANLLKQKVGLSDAVVNKALGQMLVQNYIPDDVARRLLAQIVSEELQGLGLRPREKTLLLRIGEAGSARSKQFKEFGFKSAQDFSSNYLSRLQSLNLLVRKQEGKAALYSLRGLASLAMQLGLLSDH